MIVCSCNVLSDHEIRDVVTEPREHPLSARQVYDCLGCSIRCGRCARAVKQIIADLSMMAGYERVGFVEAGKAM
jgi:bacterioferritin-associated ferredoxin